MIFISAQPDGIYFQWQLELQLENFKSLGIPKDDIHIIVGFSPLTGVNQNFRRFIGQYESCANFFIYPDTRKDPCYASSIRPHLLEKHWEQFPELENEAFFYHDSDILLTRRLRVKEELSDDTNYVSDTRSYLDVNYIRSHTDQKTFQKMTDLVGIATDRIEKLDPDAGGAQYLLKNIPKDFWHKVYGDCEKIYKLLSHFNLEQEEKSVLDPQYCPNKIQAWCTDMWAVLWNLWYYRKEVKILPELDFSWPTDSIEEWHKKAIHHYSGQHTDSERFFYKRDYIYNAPWYDEKLHLIPHDNCSFPVAELIIKHRQELNKNRPIMGKIVIEDGTSSPYYRKYFKGGVRNLNMKDLFLIPDNLVMSPNTLTHINLQLQDLNVDGLRFENVFIIDQLFTELFSKILDFDLLFVNKGKFSKGKSVEVKIGKPSEEIGEILKIDDAVFILATSKALKSKK